MDCLKRFCVCCVFACCPLQVKTEISVESKHQTLQGLAFPLQETAKRALQQLAHKRINYIQLVSLRSSYKSNFTALFQSQAFSFTYKTPPGAVWCQEC